MCVYHEVLCIITTMTSVRRLTLTLSIQPPLERYGFTWPWEEGRKEGNVLFINALNTFYLGLYGAFNRCTYGHAPRYEDVL